MGYGTSTSSGSALGTESRPDPSSVRPHPGSDSRNSGFVLRSAKGSELERRPNPLHKGAGATAAFLARQFRPRPNRELDFAIAWPSRIMRATHITHASAAATWPPLLRIAAIQDDAHKAFQIEHRSVPLNGQNLTEIPDLVHLGLNLIDLGQFRFGRTWFLAAGFGPTRARFGPTRTKFGRLRANFGRCGPTSGQIWLSSGQLRSIPGQVWSTLADLGRNRPNSSQIWSTFRANVLLDAGRTHVGRSWPNSDQVRSIMGRIRFRSKFCRVRAKLADHGRSCRKFGRTWPGCERQTLACIPRSCTTTMPKCESKTRSAMLLCAPERPPPKERKRGNRMPENRSAPTLKGRGNRIPSVGPVVPRPSPSTLKGGFRRAAPETPPSESWTDSNTCALCSSLPACLSTALPRRTRQLKPPPSRRQFAPVWAASPMPRHVVGAVRRGQRGSQNSAAVLRSGNEPGSVNARRVGRSDTMRAELAGQANLAEQLD